MSALVSDLLEASRENSKNGTCDYSEETISKLERRKTIIPVCAIDATSLDPDEIDRKSNMFGGNPFTSLKYPWPLNDSGSPFHPLVQLDLQQISELSSKEFGCGLLQVWLDITDSDLPSTIRIIDPADMNEDLQKDYPAPERTEKIDEYGSWFGISQHFSFNFLGYMMPHWGDGDIEWDYDRDLSQKEVEILNRFEELSEEHGYRSLNTNWFLGYPDRGSGAPAGKYDPEPADLIQFATSNAFPMVDVSRYATFFIQALMVVWRTFLIGMVDSHLKAGCHSFMARMTSGPLASWKARN
jgi:hypothetical protein